MRFLYYILLFICLNLFACSSNKSSLTITNASDYKIRLLKVLFCNNEIKVNNLLQGNSTTLYHYVKHDSHYTLSVNFSSGKVLVTNIGYLTTQVVFDNSAIVMNSKIVFTNNNVFVNTYF